MEEDRIRWDERFSRLEVCGGTEPAELLTRMIDRLPRGKALDLACGAGRNTLFLAGHGYEMTGIDISPVALAQGKARAEAQGLSVHWQQADLDDWVAPAETWSLVTCINFLDRRLFGEIARGLRPGGAVAYQTLLYDPAYEAGVGHGTRFRVAPNELLDAFRALGFRILLYQEWVLEGVKPTAGLVALKEGGARAA